jgi:hypothetical protein
MESVYCAVQTGSLNNIDCFIALYPYPVSCLGNNGNNSNVNVTLITGKKYNSVGAGRGSTVVKILHYKPEGRYFDHIWCHGNFHWHKSFWSHYGPGVDSASNRSEYREYFLEVNAAGA